MEKIPTKERILNAALILFAERGYDGVGVDLIAEHAGLKGPSLYKHYKGKEDILDKLIEKGDEYYEMNFGSERRPGKIPETMEELVELSMGRIQFTMHDPMIQMFRRLLAMEQFRNAKIATLATKHGLYGVQNMYKVIFKEMMGAGILKQEDPEILAMVFAAPISLFIQTFDREPEMEAELMKKIQIHLEQFVRVYKA